MLKRIIRAYGAAQDNENNNVESVANLAGVPRPLVSSNNNFLRSVGVLEIDKPKLTPLGVKLATGIGLENAPIISEALQEVVKTTPTLNQLLSTLRARGSMDSASFRGQAILATGLKPGSPNLATIRALTDLMEESGLIQIRDDKIGLAGSAGSKDNDVMMPESTTAQANQQQPPPAGSATLNQSNKPQNHVVDALLSKFPDLNPDWPDEIKNKWFDAFDRLMKGRGL